MKIFKESPWLRLYHDRFEDFWGLEGVPWLCAKTLRRHFNIPRGTTRIKILVSKRRVRGAIKVHSYGTIRTPLGEFDQYIGLSSFLPYGTSCWAWIEYEG